MFSFLKNTITTITDGFSFTTAIQSVLNSTTVSSILDYAKEQIIAQITAAIPGEEKMETVIANVKAYISENVTSDNSLVQLLITTIVNIAIEPAMQALYDNLKAFITGLTETAEA